MKRLSKITRMGSLFLLIILPWAVGTQEPGPLAELHVFEIDRVPGRTQDGNVIFLSARVRWQAFDRERFLANMYNFSLAREYLENFIYGQLLDWTSQYKYDELLVSLPSSYPYESAPDNYHNITRAFVEYVNDVDMLLTSRGIQIHSVELLLYEAPSPGNP